LEISQIVLVKDIKEIIYKLLIDKVVGLNRILNKAIKAALKALVIPLANIITICLYKGKLLNCCKITIIVVLKK